MFQTFSDYDIRYYTYETLKVPSCWSEFTKIQSVLYLHSFKCCSVNMFGVDIKSLTIINICHKYTLYCIISEW